MNQPNKSPTSKHLFTTAAVTTLWLAGAAVGLAADAPAAQPVKPPESAVSQPASEPGLAYELYYDVGLKLLQEAGTAPDLGPMDRGAGDWGLRFTGLLTAPADGEYAFRAEAVPGMLLKIGGNVMSDGGNKAGGKTNLVQGTPVSFVVEYRYGNREKDGVPALRLFWTPPGGQEAPVPAGCYSHLPRTSAAVGPQAAPPQKRATPQELDIPLLKDANDLLFVERATRSDFTHKTSDGAHMCGQYHGYNAVNGGGLFILKDFKTDHPRKIDLTRGLKVPSGSNEGMLLSHGAFATPDLSWDAKTVVFAWTRGEGRLDWTPGNTWSIFSINVDGTNLRRLTDGPYEDFDPCFLPNGRIAFISTRRGGFGRCHGDKKPTYTLYSMEADGSDIICLSFHETNEWNPSVDNNGMILYSRWDYVDRDSNIAHHLWTCYPDGTDPRAPHGNYPYPLTTVPEVAAMYNLPELDAKARGRKVDGRKLRPWGEYGFRAIPASDKYVAVAGPHNGPFFGTLILVNPTAEDDNMMSQVTRLTPEARFPEGEGPENGWWDEKYGTPWPLSENWFLANYLQGLYLINYESPDKQTKLLVYETLQGGFRPVDPIPIRPRTMPPVLPTRTHQGKRLTPSSPNATIYVHNVYATDRVGKLPEGAKITRMRIVQLFPKETPEVDKPRIGYGHQALARMILGTVPVEEDGSVYCKAPVAKEIYFQLLDETGMAIQSMRSGTYVHPGEQMSCLGCHESRSAAPARTAGQVSKALQRAPSELTPEGGVVEPLNFHRLIKPVFEGKCVACHQRKEQGGPKDMSYKSMAPYVFFFHGGNGGQLEKVYGGSRTIPGFFGARYSRMGKALLNTTHQDALKEGAYSREDYERVVMWLDNMSTELGAYFNVDRQQRGELVWPKLDVDPENPQGVERRGLPPRSEGAYRSPAVEK